MIELLNKMYKESKNKNKLLNELRTFLIKCLNESNLKLKNPIDLVIWVPIEKVQANNYNPNQVATNEMKLLYTSIKHDGYTQPVVTIYDPKLEKYIIVDGFHRYSIMRFYKDIREQNNSLLPIVVLNKNINDRMASTIRHNRARGKHSISGMAKIVFNMLENGWSDTEIMKEIGMEAEELIKIKHVSGFSKLFENVEYSRAWETKRQMKFRKEYESGV